jgi:hypothetical protein
VGVDVDVEGVSPGVLRRLEVGAGRHPGVGEEQIDGAEQRLGVIDQRDVAGLRRDVGDDPDGAGELVGDVGHAVEVGDDDAGAVGVEAPGQRGTDPPRRARDDDVATVELHDLRSYVEVELQALCRSVKARSSSLARRSGLATAAASTLRPMSRLPA